MNTSTETINQNEIIRDILSSTDRLIPKKSILSKLKIVIEIALEYCFGIHVGTALGYICGACFGSLYTNYFTPTCTDNFEEICQWSLMPYSFAIWGGIIGMVTGIVVISLMTIKRVHKTKSHKEGGDVTA